MAPFAATLQSLMNFFFFFFSLFRATPRHMEVPKLGVESEPQLPAYTTDPSHV